MIAATDKTYGEWLLSPTKLSFTDWLAGYEFRIVKPLKVSDFLVVKPFTPKVGDRVRSRTWTDGAYVNVEWVGSTGFAGKNELGVAVIHSIAVNNNPWELWTAPKPQRYEYRAPKAGERYVAFTDALRLSSVVFGPASGPSPLRLVLVDE
jgi:hypothetical protein